MRDDPAGAETSMKAGRIIGGLMLVQMAGAVIVNVYLTAPLFGTPGFLVNAAPHARQIGVSAVIGLLLGATFLAIAITAYPIVGRRSQRMALWLVTLAAVNLAVAAAEQASVMSMVSLSGAYLKAGPAAQPQFEALRGVVASARNWAHYLGRMSDGSVLLAFYAAAYRCALIPRALGVVGLAAVLLQLTGVAMPLFGHDVVFPLLAPLGFVQLALVAWLMTKGLQSRARPAAEDPAP